MMTTPIPPYLVREFLPEIGVIAGDSHKKNNLGPSNVKQLPIERVHRTLRPVLIVAQCIFLLPLHGILGPDYTYLKHSKYSWKTFVSLLFICSASALGLSTARLIFVEGVNYRVAGDVIFYCSNGMSMIFFYNLAKRWKPLMQRWAAVEDATAEFPPVRVSRTICVLTIYVVCISLCEHTLAVLYNRDPCYISWKRYYLDSFRQIFQLTSYAGWKGCLLSTVNFIMSSTWNFTDLFLMSLSIALSARFKQFQLELDSVIHKDMNAEYWKMIRELYNELTLLTKYVDENVSVLILISFTNNLYFICLQLLHTIEPVQSSPKLVYLIISFCHLLFRACFVCLTAAHIHDQSKAPLSTLFSVPSSSYNVEVQRMMLQVALENIALTGSKFFSVTRTLMLTVAGTIATYEVVLLQFSNMCPSDDDRYPSCMKYCNCSWYITEHPD